MNRKRSDIMHCAYVSLPPTVVSIATTVGMGGVIREDRRDDQNASSRSFAWHKKLIPMVRYASKTACRLATASMFVTTAFLVHAQETVRLEGAPNFRDLGDLPTADGFKIKPGLIYRSGELPHLTEADVETLIALGVRTVFNFLTDEEIAYRGEDRLPAGVRTISVPIDGEIAGIADAAVHLIEARETGDWRAFSPEFNPQIHAALASGMADAQYAELFDVLADPNAYPVVMHCSHGVHRTGTAAALVLTALGADWETVRVDYLRSNDMRAEEIERRTQELREVADGIPMSAAIAPPMMPPSTPFTFFSLNISTPRGMPRLHAMAR